MRKSGLLALLLVLFLVFVPGVAFTSNQVSNVAELFTGYGFEAKTIIGEDVAAAVSITQMPAISERNTGQLPGITILSKEAVTYNYINLVLILVIALISLSAKIIYIGTLREESQPFMKNLPRGVI